MFLTRLSCSSRGHSRTLSWSLSLSVSHLWKESDPSTPGPHAIKTVSSPSPFFSHGYSWLYWFRKFASPEAKAFQMKTGKFTHYCDFMTSCPNKTFFVFFSKQYDNFFSDFLMSGMVAEWLALSPQGHGFDPQIKQNGFCVDLATLIITLFV